MFRVYAINANKNSLPFKRTLACDELRDLLIASSNEKKCCFNPDSDVIDKFSNNN